jgi:hypothetical protein
MFPHRHDGNGTQLLTLLCAALLLATSTATAAEKVVIYRCTDGKGAVTFQNNVACPKGSKQERRVMETPPPKARPAAPAPAPPEPAATPVPEAAPLASAAPLEPLPPPDYPAADEGNQLPPPVLYECRTYNDDSYLSEIGTPQQRCVTLTTTGLGGIAAGGAGDACEMKTDECARVPDGGLCDRWRQRLREAESAVRFGASEDLGFAEAEVQRIGRIVRESVCAQ